MAHAHPATDGHFSQPATRSNHLFRPSPAADPLIIRNPSFQPPHESFNPNSRRLQLRNAGFRGTVLPTRRISPFGSSPAVLELSSRPPNDENPPRTAERRATYGENLPSSPVSILQELSNSSRRTKTLKPGLVGIFEDPDTNENRPPEPRGSSWLNEAGVDSSPAARPATPLKMMATRKAPIQEKENTPPLQSSPVLRQMKGRRKARLKYRSPSSETSRHIEHLESELAALYTRVDALTSPTMTRTRFAEARELRNQVRSQRQEISAWENRFEELVADEVFKRSEVEKDLKKTLRGLESEKEAKDARIRELESEVELAQKKAKDVESLIMTNQGLERRVDTLTQLLAQSPTRQDYQRPLPSPDRAHLAQRAPRPTSMLPRISSSPVVPRRLSLNVLTSATWRSSSFQSSDSIPENSEDSTPSKAQDGVDVDDSTPQPDPRSRPTSESVSFGSISYESGAVSSRPTSITSSTSSTSACWSLSHSSRANEDPRSVTRARRMRRFPSGAGSLKPLILPFSINGSSIPSSAPLFRPSFASSQDGAESYFDSTTAFMSIAEIANLSSPVITPSQPSRRRSMSWARNQALNALEGKPYMTGDEEGGSAPSGTIISQRYETPEAGCNSPVCTTSEETPPRQRLSLEFELSRIESTFTTPDFEYGKSRDSNIDQQVAPSLPSGPPAVDSRILFNSEPICLETPSFTHRYQSFSPCPIPLAHNTSEPLHQTPATRQVHPCIWSQTRGQPLMSHTTKPNPATALFSRLTSFVTSLRDPTILARHILHNAWTCTSTPKAHGGLGWWLMGLVYRSYHRFQPSDNIVHESNAKTDDHDDYFSTGRRDSNIDWHQFYSAEASKQRRLRAFIGDGVFLRDEGDEQCCDLNTSSPAQKPTQVESPQVSRSSKSTYDPQPVRCKDCVEPTGRQSLKIWFDFSLAIVLAVGIAIKDGPRAVMGDYDEQINDDKTLADENVYGGNDGPTTIDSTRDDLKNKMNQKSQNLSLAQEGSWTTEKKTIEQDTMMTEDAPTNDNDEEYWGWELTFHNYTAEDFEDGKEPT